LGYRNYYDYRAHNFGRSKPSEPAAKGEKLRRLRGHAAGGDLAKTLRRGKIETLHIFYKGKDPKQFEIVSEAENGDERTWYIKGASLLKAQQAIADLGPDAPTMVGSPKAIKAFEGEDEDE